MAKEKLTEDAKAFVVRSLACFDSPSVVVAAVRTEFGITVTRQTIEGYDPTKKAAKKLPLKWKVLFEAARKTFKEDASDIPIAHQPVRLRALQRMFEKAEEMKNYGQAQSILEQAAKETGGAFTNRRELTGKDGKDLPTPPPSTIQLVPIAPKHVDGADRAT